MTRPVEHPTLHGGPDAQGIPRWDFSTNANACGPAPHAWEAVLKADRTRYPDPSAAALRERLGALHGVCADRIVVAASASEFIGRMTAAVHQLAAAASVFTPFPGYGDYARAARQWRLRALGAAGDATLVWATEPASPTGKTERIPSVRPDAVLVVDEAYAPLRLEGTAPTVPPHAWRLLSPNKALGMTGVRAAYAVAPVGADELTHALVALAPSWPLGADGEALLTAWSSAQTPAWLAASRERLSAWKSQQLALCASLGWACEPSVTPFFVARWPGVEAPAALLPMLRAQGVKLRDTTDMGLPGAVRVSVQPPEAQGALRAAWQAVMA